MRQVVGRHLGDSARQYFLSRARRAAPHDPHDSVEGRVVRRGSFLLTTFLD
jgi:hypothetical protein